MLSVYFLGKEGRIMAIQRYHLRLFAIVLLVVVIIAIVGWSVALSATHHAFTVGQAAQVLQNGLLGLAPNSVWHV
jgi:hypothetical protein